MTDDEFLALLKNHPELWDTIMEILLGHPNGTDTATITPDI